MLRPTAALATTSAATQFEPFWPPTARMATESPAMPTSPAHGTGPCVTMDAGKMSCLVSASMAAVARARNASFGGPNACGPW
jgi:hypothetical protein